MKRITPRTCLWPTTLSLIVTFALSISLTYVSDHHCYAGTCGEWLFPRQARLHVVVWYLWISLSVAFLGVRAFSSRLRSLLRRSLTRRKLPILDKYLSLSTFLLLIWLCVLYGALISVWWIRLRDYFVQRGSKSGITNGNRRLAAIALTGHVCDVTMGMVLLPISRHSALVSFFKLSVSTTLTFHMLMAYTLFVLVAIHGLLYASWLPVFDALSSTLQRVYPVLNPTYLYHETWPGNTEPIGIWRASLVFTGLVTTLIMLLIFITTLPSIRNRHFNLFYFTHLLVILAVIVICLHASTMFYCTSPGLLLWLIDWAMRIYELSNAIDGTITTVSNNYHLLTLKMPRNRLDGCACTSPLAHFYIYHSESSVRELHPFTTVTHLASEKCKAVETDITIQFLFRNQGQRSPTALDADLTADDDGFWTYLRRLIQPRKNTVVEWTDKLAQHAETEQAQAPPLGSKYPLETPHRAVETFPSQGSRSLIGVHLRLEGPYFTPADPYRYHTVVCLVAGTGISGGIAVASAFVEAERQRCSVDLPADVTSHACAKLAQNGEWQRCVVVWTVRESDYTRIPLLEDMTSDKLEVQTQLTGKGRPRMDFIQTLRSVLPEPLTTSVWVYLSGPNGFILAGEKACAELGLDYYGARWEI